MVPLSRPIVEAPPVSWWHVIVDLERHGYTHGQIASVIGSQRSTVENWKNRAAGPRHDDGERLIALWCAVTMRPREDLPKRTDGVLSASAFRSLGTPRA